MSGETQSKILIIGMDSATFDLIDPWIEQGLLPNLGELISGGTYGRLASTLQPTTAPAWVTFMTGVNQGKHGLYDFVRRKKGNYALEITNSSHIKTQSIFDIASQAGQKVIVVNMPYTSPPRPVNGVIIGGPFAPTFTPELVKPESYFDEIQDLIPDYFILPDYDARAKDPLSKYLDDLLLGIENRKKLALHLLDKEPWDIFSLTFMATDEVQHSFWSFQESQEGDPYFHFKHAIRDVYVAIDEAIGEIIALAKQRADGRETAVIVLSDHGGGPFKWMVNLNRFLSDEGLLKFAASNENKANHLKSQLAKKLAYAYRQNLSAKTRKGIRGKLGMERFNQVKGEFESTLLSSSIDWPNTLAYSLGAGGNIFINLQGREPNGIVSPGEEYNALRTKIIHALQQLKSPETNQPIVRKVHLREELYNGPNLEDAPDLIIEWDDYSFWGRGRYDSQGTPVFEEQKTLDFSDLPLTGAHRPDGILIMNGPGIKQGHQITGASLINMAPTIMNISRIPIPEYFDSISLLSAFEEEVTLDFQTASTSSISSQSISEEKFEFSEEESAEITKRLQDLGYL